VLPPRVEAKWWSVWGRDFPKGQLRASNDTMKVGNERSLASRLKEKQDENLHKGGSNGSVSSFAACRPGISKDV
jgi:hypothetical protein